MTQIDMKNISFSRKIDKELEQFLEKEPKCHRYSFKYSIFDMSLISPQLFFRSHVRLFG